MGKGQDLYKKAKKLEEIRKMMMDKMPPGSDYSTSFITLLIFLQDPDEILQKKVCYRNRSLPLFR